MLYLLNHSNYCLSFISSVYVNLRTLDNYVYIQLLVMLVCRNMVLALKELSIRGDFRTTVEYLVTLLETEDFNINTIDTGWLDLMIRREVKVNSLIYVIHIKWAMFTGGGSY